MQIQINTDNHIEGHETLSTWASGEVKGALARHGDQITRVEVHLSDENGHKSGLHDKCCVLEVRLQGRPPVAVTEHAENLHQAVTGAANKMNRLIESTLGRASRPISVPEATAE